MIVNEDFMDLGPFLQHYVLRNPFSQSLYQSQRIQPMSCKGNISKLTPAAKRAGCLKFSESRNSSHNSFSGSRSDFQSSKKFTHATDSDFLSGLELKYHPLDLSGSRLEGMTHDGHPSDTFVNVVKSESMRSEYFKSEDASDEAIKFENQHEGTKIKDEHEKDKDINDDVSSTEEISPEQSPVEHHSIQSQRKDPQRASRHGTSRLQRASYLKSRISIMKAKNTKLQRQMKRQNAKFNSLLEEFTRLQRHFNYLSTLFRRFSGNFLSWKLGTLWFLVPHPRFFI